MSVPRSPPSPAGEPPAKKGKFATVDGDFEEEAAVTEPTQDVPTQPRGRHPAQPKKTKIKPIRYKKPVAVDPVLKHDILTVLRWSGLPAWTNPPSEAALLGPRTWPKRGPDDIRRDAEINGEELQPEDANRWEFTESEFKVVGLTSHGDGIAVYPLDSETPEWAIIIPFTLPGDRVRARVTRHAQYHSYAEPLQIISESPETAMSSAFPLQIKRDNSLIGCKYFGTCAGCQYQSLPYEQQLALKRWVLQKAMKNFSGLESEEIPDVKETIPSPSQYGYRTKITPHFDLPKQLQPKRRAPKNPVPPKSEEAMIAEGAAFSAAEAMYNGENSIVGQVKEEFDVPIGFEEKCRSRLLDIEECPIATPAINKAMPSARADVKKNIRDYKKGATLLFRDCLVVEEEAKDGAMEDQAAVKIEVSLVPTRKSKKAPLQLSTNVKLKQPEEHICVSDHNKTITERVGEIIFQFPAGSFFQNNASILRPLTDFVREQIELDAREKEEDRYLVDAYCGSGLFSLTLASHLSVHYDSERVLSGVLNTKVCGIEIDPASIAYANHNATINSISNVEFHSGASETLFDAVTKDLKWAGDKTTLIVDPPRKGCDAGFLKQVVAFLPRRVVYVSCNVHTMAENVGDLIRWSNEGDRAGKGYKISSVGAIDLFPQTHHTEGLLNYRIESTITLIRQKQRHLRNSYLPFGIAASLEKLQFIVTASLDIERDSVNAANTDEYGGYGYPMSLDSTDHLHTSIAKSERA
ncbi:hypothetical protein QFC21_002930 [Naganishia friedmannii]|uniref:Uncharacterized protein n=1 Tax=Naganishia friedmannii TaxID=89922 RepID=A0ACC2VTY7_9TREE|nr:hypothetical protein QFC21_002930 [Naganishia friedmannii]